MIARRNREKNSTQNQPFVYETDQPHEHANNTYYEVATTRIWPLMLIQVPKREFRNGNGFTSVEMSCLRATNVTEGSEKIGSVPGAGSMVRAGVWGLIAVGAAVGVLL